MKRMTHFIASFVVNCARETFKKRRIPPPTPTNAIAHRHASWLVCGLGNPGKEFARTKHNVGFDVIDEIVTRTRGTFAKENKALTCEVTLERGDGERRTCVACKPQTFMNLSGASVRELMRKYKVPLERVLIVYDDLDTNLGEIKVKVTGSHGGHNGVRSVIEDAAGGKKEFPRVKIGIGRPNDENVAIYEYVLSRFSEIDEKKVREAVLEAADVVREIVLDGKVDGAMKRINTKFAAPKKPKPVAKVATPKAPKERIIVKTAVEGEEVKVTLDVRGSVETKPAAVL